MNNSAPSNNSEVPEGGDARDDFMIVRPDLVRRVGGGNAAIVYARIEFRCNQPGDGRIEDEAGRWWRASMKVVSTETGLTPRMADRATSSLVQAGEIEESLHQIKGPSDQTKSYRITPRPAICPNGEMEFTEQENGSSTPSPNGEMEFTKRSNHHFTKRSNVPSFKESKEGGGQADASEVSSRAVEVAPPIHCSKHINNPTTAPCRPCGDARRARESWDREQAIASKLAISEQARERARKRAEEIEACNLCNDNGYFGTTVCDHKPNRLATNRNGMALVRAALSKGKEGPHELRPHG